MTQVQGKWWTTVQNRLILILLCILIPVLAIQAYIYYNNYQDQRQLEFRANLEVARAVSKGFESFVKDVLHQELTLGLALTSSRPMSSKDITRILGSSRDYVAVRDFTWLNPNGKAVYSSNPDVVGVDYSDRSYFREVVNGREWTVGELVQAKSTNKAVFGITRGIRNEKGTLLGIVLAAILPEKLEDRLAVERRKGGGFALIDKKGMLVFRYPVIKATWEERNWLGQYPWLGKVFKGEEIKSIRAFANFEGETRLLAATPVPSIGWIVTAATREDEITASILDSMGKSVLLFLVVAFAAFFAALIFSRKIAGPVKALRAHALSLGQGKMPEPVRINHIWEFQDLAGAVNTMAEQVQAREKDLRESEARFRSVLDNSQDVIYRLNVQTGRFDYISPSAEAVSGFSPVELMAMDPETALAMIHPEDLPVMQDLAERLDDSAEIEVEYRQRTKYGDYRWLSNHMSLVKDDTGQVLYRDGNIRDITDSKHAQEELRKSESLYRAIGETIDYGIWVSDSAGRNMYASKSLLNLVGLTQEQCSNFGWFKVLHPDDVERTIAAWTECVRNSGNWSIEHRFRGADGQWYNVLARGVPVRNELGEIICWAGINLDITSLKKAEMALLERTQQLEESNKELESFTYSVAHDLKAPIRAIDGFSRIFLKKYGAHVDEDAARILNVIRSSTEKMNVLIDGLLSFSRVLRDKMIFREINMDIVANEVWTDIHAINQKRELEVKIAKLPAGFGDLILIRQVLFNLISNAVKFTKNRKPGIIELSGYNEHGKVVYCVKDNGAGFDMAYYDKLFNVFHRLHSDEDFEGTGIGLAIVQRIVKRHGGEVWADGAVDKGATFYFSLPAKDDGMNS